MKLKIHTQIIIALILGIIAGWVLKEKAIHIKIVGDLFIRLLRMIIIPLIMASMISGILSIGNLKNLGRIGIRTFAYYMATTLLAVTVGLVLVNIIQPGVGAELGAKTAIEETSYEVPSILNILTDIVPSNMFKSMTEDKVLSVIFASLLIGIAIGTVRDKAQVLVDFFEALNTVMMKITDWIIKLAPFGVFALMAYTVGQTGAEFEKLRDLLAALTKYMTTVVLGLAIHATITLPVLLSAFGRYSPVRFFNHMLSAVVTAFSTASSAATLPISMDCLEENAGISNKITSFVMPLGATINMDGTALYEAVAAMFIAQAYGIEMSFGQQLVIMLTATLASIGAAAIPGAGLVTMIIVLKAVGLPLEGIGMILAVDRLLDMCRTAVNVWGDSCGAAVIARLEGEVLNQNQKPPSAPCVP